MVRDSGGFDSRYIHAEDYELWLRLVGEYRLANVPRILLTRREHGANVSIRFHEVQLQSAYRALCTSLEQLLKRQVPLELVSHFHHGSLPSSASDTLAVASLHGEVFRALTRSASPQQVRALAEDLAERLGVLAARALRTQPWSAPILAAHSTRCSLAGFVRAFIASLRGDPHIYRRSPIFESARLPAS